MAGERSDETHETVTISLARSRAASSQGRQVEVSAPGSPAVLRLREGVVRIGRDDACDIVVDDPFVSRTHLEVRVAPDGVIVVDLGTKNGTHHMGARIRELPVTSETALVLGRQCTVRVRILDEGTSGAQPPFAELLGDSGAMQRLRTAISRVAASNATALVEGETGVGKDVVARSIHAHSPRSTRPFVVFDCAAVSPNLLAAELFGHTRGAFTGATGSSDGAFRRAHGGTLFLDEIGELPVDLQPALLRALEARQVKPVGGEAYVPVDVRVIAATNRSLEAETEAGRFRKDLLFRLAVARIKVPPLRSHLEDVAVLARHFAGQMQATLSDPVVDALASRAWPGNVRELRNEVERAVVFAGGPGVHVTALVDDEDDFDDETLEAASKPRGLTALAGAGLALRSTGGAGSPMATIPPGALVLPQALPPGVGFQDAKQAAVDQFEREYLARLFVESAFNLSEASRRSGVHRRYLRELFKKHGLEPAQLRAQAGVKNPGARGPASG